MLKIIHLYISLKILNLKSLVDADHRQRQTPIKWLIFYNLIVWIYYLTVRKHVLILTYNQEGSTEKQILIYR